MWACERFCRVRFLTPNGRQYRWPTTPCGSSGRRYRVYRECVSNGPWPSDECKGTLRGSEKKLTPGRNRPSPSLSRALSSTTHASNECTVYCDSTGCVRYGTFLTFHYHSTYLYSACRTVKIATCTEYVLCRLYHLCIFF